MTPPNDNTCNLEYVDGYLECTIDHHAGTPCLMDEKSDYMTLQQRLRELANKLLPERMKLEFGCEVEYMGRKYLFVEDDPIFEHRLYKDKKTYTKKRFLTKNLGKPVSTNDLLRMLNKNKMAIAGNGDILSCNDNGGYTNTLIFIDLTKDIEWQDEKVLLEIIKILTCCVVEEKNNE